MSTNFFSSLSGNYDYFSSMTGLLGDYNTIKSGAYSTLMKSYVGKVGNGAALKAYQETGSTTAAGDTGKTNGSNFLDSYFKDKTTVTEKASASDKTSSADKTSASTSTTGTTETVTADKYAKYKSSWLDNQLSQYNKDASKTTAADTAVSVDTTI